VQDGRAFNARDYECLVRNHVQTDVPGQQLFWRTALSSEGEFEVRYNDEVIQRCYTIRRNGTGTCPVNLPPTS